MENLYLKLISDSFLAAFLLPVDSELILPAMSAFPEYNLYVILSLAFIAGMAGHVLNWYFGREILKRIFSFPEIENSQREIYKKICDFFNRYLICIVIFCGFLPVGSFITLLAGMLLAKPGRFLLFCAAAKIGHYIWVYFI